MSSFDDEDMRASMSHAAGVSRAHERVSIVLYIQSEAARIRERDEGADAAVAAHFEIIADQIARGDHGVPRPSTATTQDNDAMNNTKGK